MPRHHSEHAPRPSACVIVFAVSVALAGCTSPQLYSSDLTRLNYKANQHPASIQVSDPQFYQRHALINERHDELAYLKTLLGQSETTVFEPDLARDIETIRSMTAALGLSFDAGAKQSYRFASETNEVSQQIALENLRGQLAQTQRDVELLKSKLAEQTAPSATSSTAKPSASSGASAATPDIKAALTQMEASIDSVIARLDRTSVAARVVSTTKGSPQELFQDRQAYRRDIQGAINSVSLDALHDLGPNSLFRLQFQATVMPGEASDEMGVLQMQLKRPRYARNQIEGKLQPLYLEWLDYTTASLNELNGKGYSDPALNQLALEGRMFRLHTINTGMPLYTDAGRAASPTAPPLANSSASVFTHIDPLFAPDKRKSVLPRPKVGAPAACKFGLVAPDSSEDPSKCLILKLAYPANYKPERFLEWQTYFRKNSAHAIDMLSGIAVANNAKLSAGPGCDQLLEQFKHFPGSLSDRVALHRLQRAYSWSFLTSKSDDHNTGREVAAISASVQAHLRAVDLAVAEAKKKGCAGSVWESAGTTEPITPSDFISTLFAQDTAGWLVARGRLTTYAVSPTALVQRVSTAARAADAIQIAASLAVSLPMQGAGAGAGFGYMRSVSGKADAIERIPLVVGFSSQATESQADGTDLDQGRFGWLLGPKVVMDTERKALALEHNLAPYALTADVSMPGWWPEVTIESQAAWAPDWKSDRARLISAGNAVVRTSKVPMRHTKADLDSLTTLLLNADLSSVDAIGAGIKLPSPQITQIHPTSVSNCAGNTTFLVKGKNLWRANSAYLSGVKSGQVEVMPDMGGLIVSFELSQLPPGDAEAQLIIPTPDGDANFTLKLRDDRSATGACPRAPAAAPSGK